mmetsp:Transcript_42201/g.68503  ORF Transcript_42201/g.68503 Transcript_42201/m.68503 type:complete len:209 (+) Transcript_42201:1463-2089(+)
MEGNPLVQQLRRVGSHSLHFCIVRIGLELGASFQADLPQDVEGDKGEEKLCGVGGPGYRIAEQIDELRNPPHGYTDRFARGGDEGEVLTLLLFGQRACLPGNVHGSVVNSVGYAVVQIRGHQLSIPSQTGGNAASPCPSSLLLGEGDYPSSRQLRAVSEDCVQVSCVHCKLDAQVPRNGGVCLRGDSGSLSFRLPRSLRLLRRRRSSF